MRNPTFWNFNHKPRGSSAHNPGPLKVKTPLKPKRSAAAGSSVSEVSGGAGCRVTARLGTEAPNAPKHDIRSPSIGTSKIRIRCGRHCGTFISGV